MPMKTFLRLLYIIIFSLAFVACKDDEKATSTDKELRRTVLVYQCAQNSLGYHNYHRMDSLEIVNGRKYINDNDCLLVFTDDGRGCARLYRYISGNARPLLVRLWDHAVNASDPSMLQEVLTWTREHFTAREYGLVFWSHADGWLPSTNTDYAATRVQSFGIDVGTDGDMHKDRSVGGDIGAQMNIPDLASAVANSGIHARYIFFDACLMQTLEVAYDLRNVTDYIVASPFSTPGYGAYYTHLLRKGLFSNDPTDIARTFYADVVEDAEISPQYDDFGMVISCLKTEGLELLAEVTREVLGRSSLMLHASPDMGDVLHYQSYEADFFYRPHAFDALAAMSHLLSAEDYALWSNAFSQVLVWHGISSRFWVGPSLNSYFFVNSDFHSGVSMFVPQAVYGTNAPACPHGDHNKNFRQTAWYAAAGFAQTGW